MSADRNESDRKPRSRTRVVEPAPNPFKSRKVEKERGRLENVPGVLGSIEAICGSGRAIMFARTRDGGAWAIQVLDGDSRFKEYAADQGELDDLFRDLLDSYGIDS